MPIGRGQIPAQIEGKLRGARGEKRRVKLYSKGGLKDPRVGTGKKPKGTGRRLYTDENPRDTVRIKFATPADARATVRKVRNINKPFARKIQILTVMEQRAKVMGKRQVVNIANQAKKQIRKTRKV
jgi:hypothetical protein|tara:strand:- start:197 stop:574 length:378 start_codon:yes stop_codon:yes gene_type:complete